MSTETTLPPSADPAPVPKMRRGLKIAFIASVTLNFLVLGVVVGGVIAHRKAPPPPIERGSDALTFGPLGGAFNREDRMAMRRAAEGRGADFPAMQAAIRSDFSRLEAALTADPWDEAAVRAVLADMRARTLKRMDIGEHLMLERLGTMDASERKRFVERLRKGVERFSQHIADHAKGPDRAGPPGAN